MRWDTQRWFRNGASGKNRTMARRCIFEGRRCFPSTESSLKHQIRITASCSSSQTSAGFLFRGDRIPIQYLRLTSSGWPRLKIPNVWTAHLQLCISTTITLGGSDPGKLIWSTSWSSWSPSIVLNWLCNQWFEIESDGSYREEVCIVLKAMATIADSVACFSRLSRMLVECEDRSTWSQRVDFTCRCSESNRFSFDFFIIKRTLVCKVEMLVFTSPSSKEKHAHKIKFHRCRKEIYLASSHLSGNVFVFCHLQRRCMYEWMCEQHRCFSPFSY